ncbi:MAG: helix-turn-helix transcriptional regulator [Symploca sp. SIO1C4]|uniref:Helix-turn-helix transcriptional regulator n=1 Tax=Symploca sp. SIO1C4 TaxID=2607765 RepID=A0A6B3NGI0_9CYAN|nr:helix-turn-helix transcriptional regulator [Symploca sp. SIO1C4]NET08209.1 helix-turn-helix transcriptional regulator [Symploca sp. SIO2B6]
MIEDLINGILILNTQGQMIYANYQVMRLFRKLKQSKSATTLLPEDTSLPEEVCHICQYLIETRNLFPNQIWQLETEIITDSYIFLKIKARWLILESESNPFLLVTVEDKRQTSQKIIMEDAKKYGLTDREMEVWLLHQDDYTYKEIAADLDITPNTVKKHMKSIYVKRRKFLEKGDMGRGGEGETLFF